MMRRGRNPTTPKKKKKKKYRASGIGPVKEKSKKESDEEQA